MADLVLEFFQRDLSEAEHDALSRLLEQSPDAALNYQSLLEQNYLATGLPQPTLPKGLQSLPHIGGGGLPGSGTFLKLFLVGLAATGLAVWKFWPQSKAVVPAAVQKAASKSVIPSVIHRVKPSVPLPVTAGPTQEGRELSILLNTAQKSLVTVRILGPDGREVRSLYTGFVQPGKWSFQWDGLLQNGEAAGAGDYKIDVQSGESHLSKDIQIKLKPTNP